ncbi:Ornithine carbamoyltransferase, catabolic [Aerococcus viridans]|uniref:Ornithine carbamoyltransferase n=2 Tax=Aerococcus viridans TaxID=1377 RepID=A0AAU8U3P5_9LACT|nr:ornithine carbamoyltransferase [Aerococcus viridans]AMC00859.1 ornithine carbamoyltransferase [Aerococcus viridans]EFG50488.1 ornithine carbamoyltransferase [Aerococcus viridans ATCC 11563 = CCUG 4311]SPT61774.1 Ornithine carbamoyltransferase, catabolic [Aerococcus viridans]SUU05371.1 Ornithine carbamoyltransferase, catabolic [Aerococcus viridans]
MNLQNKNFLKLLDYTSEEIEFLIDFALHLKKLKKANIPHEYLKGQNIALLFEKSSTRTRAAFTVAVNDLGGHPEYLGANDIQLGKKESVIDTAKVLGAMFDGIEYRGFDQEAVELLGAHAGVPVWNGLTDTWHPTQMIADFMTIKEIFGCLKGHHLVYLGDGRNNMANSLMIAGAKLGVDITIATSSQLQPEQDILETAQDIAKATNAKITVTNNPVQAVKTANIIYTDVWVSMGEEASFEDRIKQLMPFQVNKSLIDQVETANFIFLHCLPAFHDAKTTYGQQVLDQYGYQEMEVTDEVFQADYAKQFLQAENRLHSIKAIMAATNGNLFWPNNNDKGGD